MATTKQNTQKSNSYEVVAGLDVGNGFLKGLIAVNGKTYKTDMPSAMAYTSQARLEQPINEETLADLANNLDATIVSPAVAPDDCGRVIFGHRAVASGLLLTQFTIDSHVPKSQESLSAMLVLDAVVSRVVALAGEGGTLPDDIEVSCKLAIALPIDDYLGHREQYRKNLMDGPHRVVVQNFDHDVAVRVTFTDVDVEAEGVAALDALKGFGADFLDKVLAAERNAGADIDASYTGAALASAGNVVGIDVGEGTVNFPVFTNGKLDSDNSESINWGFGTVLDDVVSRLRKKGSGIPAESRGAIEEILLSSPEMLKQKRIKESVEAEVAKVVPTFCREVVKEFTSVWRRVGASAEVVYIYGGGANFVRDVLAPKISAATEADGLATPVICLDSSYSRNLNATGLFAAAERL